MYVNLFIVDHSQGSWVNNDFLSSYSPRNIFFFMFKWDDGFGTFWNSLLSILIEVVFNGDHLMVLDETNRDLAHNQYRLGSFFLIRQVVSSSPDVIVPPVFPICNQLLCFLKLITDLLIWSTQISDTSLYSLISVIEYLPTNLVTFLNQEI